MAWTAVIGPSFAPALMVFLVPALEIPQASSVVPKNANTTVIANNQTKCHLRREVIGVE